MLKLIVPNGEFYTLVPHSCSFGDVSLVLAVAMGPVETFERKFADLEQGHEDLDGQNSVQHIQLDGVLHSKLNLETVHDKWTRPWTAYRWKRGNGYWTNPAGLLFPGASLFFTGSSTPVSGVGVCPELQAKDNFTSWFSYSVAARNDGITAFIEYTYQYHCTWDKVGQYDYEVKTLTSEISYLGKGKFLRNGTTMYGEKISISSAQPGPLLGAPKDLWRYVPSVDPDWGSLSQQIADSCRVNDINMISYCKEIPELGEMVKSTWECIYNYDNPKSWADLFLSVKYGWKMTYLDTMDLIDTIRDNVDTTVPNRRSGHASRTIATPYGDVYCTETIHYYVDSTPESQFKKVLDSGFFPTAGNLWDMVPFSFVINWLTGLDGIVSAIDDGVYLATMPVTSVTLSEKYEGVLPAAAVPTGWDSGGVNIIAYKRSVGTQPPFPRFHTTETGIKRLLQHKVELGALVAQKVL